MVLIFDKVVVKLPYWKTYRGFIKGLLSNMTEVMLSRSYPESRYLVPVLWSIKGGWLVVMPRVRDCAEPLVAAFMVDLFLGDNTEDQEADEVKRYCEYVVDNYGMYRGKPLCRDYGTFMPVVATQSDIDRELDMREWNLEKRIKLMESKNGL